MEINTNAIPPRGAHAPGKVVDSLEGVGANYVSIAWDKNFFGRDTSAGYASVPSKDGVAKVSAAWTGADFARDRVVVDAGALDVYEKSMVGIFTDAVARNEAALGELRSNLPVGTAYQPKNGTFDFVYDRPGTTNDLRYVGLIEAAPKPILDILEAASGFRKHF
ncbi:MAG: hypothetical protein JWO69_799 [Thermoleophilia bacterium]|nr:hypothetical protein [Thermoleophilia bacterium]